MESNIEFLGKYIIVGDSQAGKSSLGIMYTYKDFFNGSTSTIGIDLFLKNVDVDGIKYKIQIWDTAGQERFITLIRSYYRGANCILYCFDITNRETFDRMESWIKESDEMLNRTVVKCLVGTKKDLEDKRKVTVDEAKKFAKLHNMEYFETSSKYNNGVNELFDYLNRQVIKLRERNIIIPENKNDPGIILKKRHKRIGLKCC